jgi:hypothetical protein
MTARIPSTTDEELQRAIEAELERPMTQRRAISVHYDQARVAIGIELTDGAAVRLPRLMIAEFRDVSPADMVGLRVSPVGYGIRLDAHDITISVHGLVAALATPGDMAASLGRLGGSAKTDKKRDSARANGAKGGRPRKIPRAA